jgi:hypothetical protein
VVQHTIFLRIVLLILPTLLLNWIFFVFAAAASATWRANLREEHLDAIGEWRSRQ